MDPEYLKRLSPDVQELVARVELDAGIDIKVQLDTSRAGRGPEGKGVLACDVDEFGATILMPSEDYFPDQGVVHEVLHVKRLLVEGVPRLSPNIGYGRMTSELIDFVADFDNMLEHLVIVPQELAYTNSKSERWERITERTFQHDIPKMAVEIGVRRAALMQWAFVELVLPDTPVRAIAEAFLAEKGLATAASDFAASVKPLLSSKAALTKHVFDQLQLPGEMAVLRHYNSRAQDSRDETL